MRSVWTHYVCGYHGDPRVNPPSWKLGILFLPGTFEFSIEFPIPGALYVTTPLVQIQLYSDARRERRMQREKEKRHGTR